jgi:hypothetical protein
MFGDDCRFCSHEKSVSGVYTKIEKVNGVYTPVGRGRTTTEMGEYCNNIGTWVKDMHYCPARWTMYRGVDKESAKPKPKKVKKHVIQRRSRKRKNKMENKKKRKHRENSRSPAHRPAKVIKDIKSNNKIKRSLPR